VQLPSSRLAARHVALLLQVQGATLADVYEARMLIEPSAARLAAERAPKPAAKALQEIIRDEESAIDDAEAFSRAAIRFQERLVEVSGNRTLRLLTHMLHDLVEMQRRAGVARNGTYPDRISVRRQVVDAHRRLAELIGSGNGVKAEALWRRFLSEVAAIVLGPRAARTVVTQAH
jgi:GntR family transcriptional regulator, transcriptional repressor for pyruvate dehydrogenase complex